MYNYKTSIFDELEDMFDELKTFNRADTSRGGYYHSYTLDGDKAFYVEIFVPGFSKDEITINIDDEILTVVAHQADETFSNVSLNDIKYVRKLPSVNTEVTAECNCGILRLKFVEPEKKTNARKVDIA